MLSPHRQRRGGLFGPSTMIKMLAIAVAVTALTACSSMNRPGTSMGNAAETKNSTDANKSGNSSAVSPGGGAGAAGSGSGAAGTR
jgi:hypothetical protein